MSLLSNVENTTDLSAPLCSASHQWFALRTRSNFEKIAACSLRYKGYEPYLPFYSERRRWSDRSVKIESPLFPGFLFCRFDIEQRLPILTTPGIVSVVGVGRQPIPVEEHEIASIEALVKSGLTLQRCPYMQEGQRVYIERGPLSGLQGTFVQTKGHECRIIVSVTMLQRSVSAEIDREWVTTVN